MSMINIAGAQHVRWATKSITPDTWQIDIAVWGSKKANGQYGSYTEISISTDKASLDALNGGEVGVGGEKFMGDYKFGETVASVIFYATNVTLERDDKAIRFKAIDGSGLIIGWVHATCVDGQAFKEIK
jgi:hypothetical protein